MIVTFTLQSQYADPIYVAGPFNISGTTSGNVTTELASGLTKAQLLTGYTINNVDDLTTGGTIASTGVCTNTTPWSTGIAPAPTPTPTSTSTAAAGTCWSYTYSTFNQPTGVSVRWRNVITDQIDTELITNLQSMDNGDNTITTFLCVSNSGSYSTPVCVVSGMESPCPDTWINSGCSCTDSSICALGCD